MIITLLIALGMCGALKVKVRGRAPRHGCSNLSALLEEGLPFWCRVCASVEGVKRLEMKEKL